MLKQIKAVTIERSNLRKVIIVISFASQSYFCVVTRRLILQINSLVQGI